jgi:quinolinate synthase
LAAQSSIDTRNWFTEIARLKRERAAIILAHYYQEPDIQDIADKLGDSLALARAAQSTTAKVIVFCGVHFMAETAKILNPEKTVVVPDLEAGCSLAESCPADALAKMKTAHPDHVVVSYINTTAAVKALSDYVCTSSNAKAVIEAIPKSQPILFVPDIHLGRYLVSQTGRDMLLWQGTCIVHETFNEKRILQLLAEHPQAQLIAHPECDQAILRHARVIGSTQKLLDYAVDSPIKELIVATESGILHSMRKRAPHKTFIPAAPENGDPSCGCSTCPHMRRNTLEKIFNCLRDLQPAISISEDLRRRALAPIEKMLSIA